MTIQITQVEVISVALGMVIGYKLKVQIAAAIVSLKKAVAGVLVPKP